MCGQGAVGPKTPGDRGKWGAASGTGKEFPVPEARADLPGDGDLTRDLQGLTDRLGSFH